MPHKHERYELVYFFNGECNVNIEREAHLFTAGHYYFIKPNILHDEYYCTTGESLVFWFEIEGDFDIPSYIIQTDETLNLYNFAERIRREIEIKSFGYNMIVNSLLLEIITLLGRQYNLKTHNTNFLIENIVNYVNEYFMTPLKISELAATCNYSTDHFRRLFEKITGKKPKDYILDKRINLAKKLLAEKKMTIADITEACGFEYYSQFCAVFKKKIGKSPAEYRALSTPSKPKE